MYNRNLLEVHILVVAIAQEGSFVRAAKALGIARPSLTRKIALFEQNLGTRLFSRTTRKVELTKAGKLFVMESTLSLEHADRALNLARYQAQIENGPFRIGYSPYIQSAFLPLLYTANLTSNEPSGIVLECASTREMVERVLRGRLHAALGIRPIRDNDLWVRSVGYEGFAVCVPRNHPLALKPSLTVKELDRQMIFWLPRSLHPGFYGRVMKYIRSLGVEPLLKEVCSQAHALEFSAQGFGLALLPRSAARISRPGVVFKSLVDRYLGIETIIIMRRDQRYGPVKDFVDELANRLQKVRLDS